MTLHAHKPCRADARGGAAGRGDDPTARRSVRPLKHAAGDLGEANQARLGLCRLLGAVVVRPAAIGVGVIERPARTIIVVEATVPKPVQPDAAEAVATAPMSANVVAADMGAIKSAREGPPANPVPTWPPLNAPPA